MGEKKRRRVFDNRAKRAWWQVHVDARKKSGLTPMQYSREHGLSVDTFRAWRRELMDWEERKELERRSFRKRYRPVSHNQRLESDDITLTHSGQGAIASILRCSPSAP